MRYRSPALGTPDSAEDSTPLNSHNHSALLFRGHLMNDTPSLNQLVEAKKRAGASHFKLRTGPYQLTARASTLSRLKRRKSSNCSWIFGPSIGITWKTIASSYLLRSRLHNIGCLTQLAGPVVTWSRLRAFGMRMRTAAYLLS